MSTQDFLTPLPASHPINRDPSPLAQWNNDWLIKKYLETVGEPVGGTDRDMLRARLQVFRARMFELDALRARTVAEGRVSDEIDRELAGTLYKRKLLLCMTFPVLDLPTEILTAIFRYVVWSSHGADQANLHRLHISWVCRRFRQVAIGDQTLWNSIWFRDIFPWRRSFTFIERSGTAPLDIRINEKEKKPGEDDANDSAITIPQIDLILDAILPKISQVRILVVLLEKLEVAERFVTRFSTAGNPSSLERYEVHRSGAPYLWPPEKANGTGTGGLIPLSTFPTPKLRWLSLNGIPLDWMKLPPVNLRTLDFRRMSIQTCPTSERWTQMLEASPSLYKLSLDAAGPQWAPGRLSLLKRIYLPNLRDLLIGDISCLYALYILGHFYAPGVMSLSLMHLSGQDYTQLIDLTIGNFPSLRILAMWTVEMPTSQEHLRKVVRWIEAMPRLKMIKIAETKRFLIDAFSEDPTKFWTKEEKEVYAQKWKETHGEDAEMKPPVLVPLLDTVFFQLQKKDDISSLVVARKKLGVPIKKVYMPDINTHRAEAAELDRIRSETELSIVFQQAVTSEEEDIHEEMAVSLGLAQQGLTFHRMTKRGS